MDKCNIKQPQQQPRLLNQLAAALELRQCALKTKLAYRRWTIRFIKFHNLRHPEEMGAKEIKDFLNHLLVSENLSAPTRHQALNALIFLYKRVLRRDIGELHRKLFDETIINKSGPSTPAKIGSWSRLQLLLFRKRR